LFAAIYAAGAPAIPPSADTAKAAIDKSPRHSEYVEVALPGSETKIRRWVSYPESKDKAPVIIVIHEIFGLTDWIESVADALAAEGFIAIAPDLISGVEGAKDNPRAAIGTLTDEEVVKRLNAVRDYALALPAANGKLGTIGFCWGGKSSFLYAVEQPKLDAAVVYYGTAPEPDKLSAVVAPVQAHYGQNDERVNATIEATEAKMKELKKTYEFTIYDGAGHGFLRQQDGNEANAKAARQAWPATLKFLREHTK
jgi:carboxymethylenebutenolidase